VASDARDGNSDRRLGVRGLISAGGSAAAPGAAITDLREAYWRNICFYASPIGQPGSEQREHADAFQESLVEPAIAALDPRMTVVRSDELPSSPITASVIEHVVHSQLVIADLSFHNPNVLYEVGVRDAHDKPFVLVSRAEDPIPSNLHDFRVIQVSMDRVPAFVSEMEMRRAQIADYARWAIAEGRKSDRGS
jgi:hypothetical protein